MTLAWLFFEPVGLFVLLIGLPLALWPYETIRNTVELRDSTLELGSGRTNIDGRPSNLVRLTQLIGVMMTIAGAAVLLGMLG